MATRRLHIRAPGVKSGSTIGPLGPFRGTLGIHWVLGAIAVGLVIVLAGSWFLFREPGPPFERVEAFTMGDLEPGIAREAFSGVFLGLTDEGRPLAVTHPDNNCPIEFADGVYVDCFERAYDLEGNGNKRTLVRLPVEVHGGAIFVDITAAE